MLYNDNTEPSLEELLNDPIARQLMSRDGLSMACVQGHIDDARRRFRGRRQMSIDALPDFPK